MVSIIDIVKDFDDINRIEKFFLGNLTVKEEVEVGTITVPFIVYKSDNLKNAFIFDEQMLVEQPGLMSDEDWSYLKNKFIEIV